MYAKLNLAASAAVKVGNCRMQSVLLTGGSDAATVILYDSLTTSGTVIAKLAAAANTTVSWSPPGGINVQIGIYAVITGTAPSITVTYG